MKNEMYVIYHTGTQVMTKMMFSQFSKATQEAIRNPKPIGDPDPKKAFDDYARSNIR